LVSEERKKELVEKQVKSFERLVPLLLDKASSMRGREKVFENILKYLPTHGSGKIEEALKSIIIAGLTRNIANANSLTTQEFLETHILVWPKLIKFINSKVETLVRFESIARELFYYGKEIKRFPWRKQTAILDREDIAKRLKRKPK